MAVLFRVMAGLLFLLMVVQIALGLTSTVDISYGVLFAAWRVAIAVALFLTPFAAASAPAQQLWQAADVRASLSGAWVRNPELSEDGPGKTAEMQAERRSSTGGGRGGDQATGTDPSRREAMRTEMSRAASAPHRLTITVADGKVTFLDSDGLSQTFATTNKQEKHHFDNWTVETKAKWDDGRLIREVPFESGLKRTETYELLKGEKPQLRLTLKLEGGRMPSPVTVNSVYDTATAK